MTDGAPLLTAEEMAAADRRTIDELRVPSLVLMESAAWACCSELLSRWPQQARRGVTLVCGPGNNGGDGLAMARRLHLLGLPVRVVLHEGRRSADCERQLAMLRAVGVEPEGGPSDGAGGVLVDAIFGTGLARDVGGAYAASVQALNAAGAPVLAVDIPSGVSGTSGAVLGVAVRADATVTFAAAKRGHFLQPGRPLAGALVVADIGIPVGGASLRLVGPEALRQAAPEADPRAHKGTFGHVLVVAGSPGKTGAAALTALAALRAGAGLVTLAVPEGGSTEAPAEVMTATVPGDGGVFTEASLPALQDLLSTRDALALGPGLGTDPRTRPVVAALHAHAVPAVVDADGLNLLGGALRSDAPRVLTPHPGELRRLIDATGDRVADVRALADASGGVALLKGASTLVHGAQTWLVPTGNPAMGTAGSGDVLTGVVAALLARGAAPELAARAAAWWHGAAGDRAAAARGEPGVIASDLAAELGPAWLDARDGRSPAPLERRP